MTSTTTPPRAPASDLPERVRTLVVGAGFAGLGTAIKLDEHGFADFLVVDKGQTVGGTWRDNTYPGAACDVPSQLYSFSFAPNPDWSRSFSPQPEIQAYLERVARELRRARPVPLRRHRRRTPSWDEDEQVWHVGHRRRHVVADVGDHRVGRALRAASSPRSTGIDSFEGEIFHSARWNHDYDLTGKRVAVIGTGASAIQIVPEVAKQAAHLDVYQRTAPWVMPRGDRDYKAIERFAFRYLPFFQKAYRTGIYWGRECFVPGFTVNPKLAAPAKKLALKNIERGISDPELRKAVTPELPDRLQAHPDLQRLLPRARLGPRRPRHRRASPRSRRPASSRPTARAPRGRRDHRGHRLLHDRAADRRAHQGTRRTHARRRVARDRHGGVQGHHDQRLPQPVPDRRPQHRAGTLVDGVHHREPDRLHRLCAPADGRARLQRCRADARTRSTPGTPTCSAACSAPCGAPAAARAGTSTPTAATPPCGRAPPSSSASCCAVRPRPVRRDHPRRRHHHEGAAQREDASTTRSSSITGAGSGMGREMALIAARQGALLAVSDWNEQGLAETVDLLKARRCARAAQRRRRRRRPCRHGRVAEAVVEQFGRVNMVVNNAGVTVTGDFEEMSLRGLRLDRRRQLHRRGQRHQGVPAPPDRLRRRRAGQHLQPLRPDQHARPDGLQRHQVRRPRLHRGAARGDADQRAPRDRHLRPPRRHQDRHRPQRSQDRQPGRRSDRLASSTRSSPG